MSFVVQVPFSPALGDSVFREFPADEFDIRDPWREKRIIRWTRVLKLHGNRRPAARMTFALGDDGAWKMEDSHVCVKYEGTGLQEELLKQASEIFGRAGINLQMNRRLHSGAAD